MLVTVDEIRRPAHHPFKCVKLAFNFLAKLTCVQPSGERATRQETIGREQSVAQTVRHGAKRPLVTKHEMKANLDMRSARRKQTRIVRPIGRDRHHAHRIDMAGLGKEADGGTDRCGLGKVVSAKDRLR